MIDQIYICTTVQIRLGNYHTSLQFCEILNKDAKSVLLFNLVLEALAIALCTNNQSQGIKSGDKLYLLSILADNMTFTLLNPSSAAEQSKEKLTGSAEVFGILPFKSEDPTMDLYRYIRI